MEVDVCGDVGALKPMWTERRCVTRRPWRATLRWLKWRLFILFAPLVWILGIRKSLCTVWILSDQQQNLDLRATRTFFLLSFMHWAQTELQPVSGDLNPVNLNTTDSFAGNFLWNYCFIVSDFTVLRQDQHVLMDQELNIHDGSSSLPCWCSLDLVGVLSAGVFRLLEPDLLIINTRKFSIFQSRLKFKEGGDQETFWVRLCPEEPGTRLWEFIGLNVEHHTQVKHRPVVLDV